jgi:hypothetical protein
MRPHLEPLGPRIRALCSPRRLHQPETHQSSFPGLAPAFPGTAARPSPFGTAYVERPTTLRGDEQDVDKLHWHAELCASKVYAHCPAF